MNDLLSPNDMIHSGLCIGCGSCVAERNFAKAEMQWDSLGQLQPTGDDAWLRTPSTGFTQTCPFSPRAVNESVISSGLFPNATKTDESLGRFQSAFVGYAPDFRVQGSSGGMVSWVAAELLQKGLIDGVAHVVAAADPQQEKRFFHYRISRTEKDIREGAKSRYYPVDMSQILDVIREVPGRYAVVGIPCFIKAVQLLRLRNPLFRERIRFTLGLFCGHMKSSRFVESFAWQMNVPVKDIQRVDFRYKDPDRPANLYTAMLTLRNGTILRRDWWHLADGDWGAGFFMNNACNYCDDVVAETADISFGDAWVEPYSSDGKGTNVVIVRSELAGDLIAAGISEGSLRLQAVDGAFVAQTQAAGFRQRREGLAYRLSWNKAQLQPRKRVPASRDLACHRRIIYHMRYQIAAWSHRVFGLARVLRFPAIYIGWARIAASVYHGYAYHKGNMREMAKRLRQLKKG